MGGGPGRAGQLVGMSLRWSQETTRVGSTMKPTRLRAACATYSSSASAGTPPSPAAAGINGEVFVVHGGVAAVMAPPRIRATFQAAEHGSADGMWTLDAVHAALGPVFGAPAVADGPAPGFACEDTIALASETIGFS